MTSFAFSYPLCPLVKVSPWDDARMSIVDQTKGPLSVIQWWLETRCPGKSTSSHQVYSSVSPGLCFQCRDF